MPAPQLRPKGLREYIALTRQHRLLADVAMLNMLDSGLRQWRNHIHPGKALRTGVLLIDGHAQIAVTAANALARLVI